MLLKCRYLKQRRKKDQLYYFCTKSRKIVNYDCFRGCLDKEYKQPKPIKKINPKNKVTKATSIDPKVKKIVWERGKKKCIFCHIEVDLFYANSHYIKRSHLGMGIPQNIFTACQECHDKFDNTIERENMLPIAKYHLMGLYDDWDEEMLIYKKYKD